MYGDRKTDPPPKMFTSFSPESMYMLPYMGKKKKNLQMGLKLRPLRWGKDPGLLECAQSNHLSP